MSVCVPLFVCSWLGVCLYSRSLFPSSFSSFLTPLCLRDCLLALFFSAAVKPTLAHVILGASINLFTYEHYKTADIDVWVTSLSILIVMVSFTLVRFSIKGIANSSRKRRLRYAYRFCLSFLCILVSPSQSS